MNVLLDHAIEVLRAHEADLREQGVLRAAVFGSVARGESNDASDLDILIETTRHRPSGIFGMASLQTRIAELFSGRVDVIPAEGLKPAFAERAKRDAVYAW